MFANRYGAATQAYMALLRAHPADATLHAEHALLLNYSRDFPAAYREAEAARALAPADPHVAAIRCRVDDWAGRLTAGLRECRSAVAVAPRDALGRLFLAEALADSGDRSGFDVAITTARTLIPASAPEYLRAELHREIANAAHDHGDLGGQIQELLAARDAQPRWIERSSELVEAYNAAGDVGGARAALDALLPLMPDDVSTLSALGAQAIADSDFTAARVLYDHAGSLAPRDPAVLIARAECALTLDHDIGAAETLLVAALHDDPQSSQAAAYLLAVDRYLLGDDGRARATIAQAWRGGDNKGLRGRTPPDPDARQVAAGQSALDAVNRSRKQAGLPAVTLDAHLSESAQRHSAYWLFNNADPTTVGLGIHRESQGLLGFRGTTAGARALAAGYGNGRIGEDITHRGGPTDAVADWVNSVYHRFAIVRPDLVSIGYGELSVGPLPMEDMEFGFAVAQPATAVVFPGADVTGTPTFFVDNELPDPVPAGQPRTTGYPVTVTFAANDDVQVTGFSLADPAGVRVDAYRLDPSVITENSASLLPVVPLHGGTRYTATITATVNGVPSNRTWRFTTGG